MNKVIAFIKHFSFWGIMFLLILVLGYWVSVLNVLSVALSFDGLLSWVCIYLLLSIVVYPLTAVIYYKKSDIPFYMLLPFGFNELFTIPFIGLDISPIFMAVKYKAGKKMILRETGICIFRLFEMVVWWCLVITVLSAVFLTGDNAILKAITRLSTSQNLFVVICVFLIYLFNAIRWINDTYYCG